MNNKIIIRIILGALALALLCVLILKNVNPKSQEEEVSQVMKKTEPQTQVFHVSPSSSVVNGPLHDYFEVVDRKYKVVDRKLNVELRRIETGFPEPWEDNMPVGYSDGCFEPGFYVEVMDVDGDVVCKDETSVISNRKELITLSELNVGESAVVGFWVGGNKLVKFRIGSSFKVNEKSEETASVPEIEEDVKNEDVEDNNSHTSSSYQDVTAQRDGNVDETEMTTENDEYEEDMYEELDDNEEKSMWQKVKDKSKRTYKKTKEYSKKIYHKAKDAFNRWLEN